MPPVKPPNENHVCTVTNNAVERDSSVSEFMHSIPEKGSVHNVYQDEIVCFLRSTTVMDKRADALEQWRTDMLRFLHTASVAAHTLLFQASSDVSKE